MAKHLSRAKRCSRACDQLRAEAEKARDIAAAIQAEVNPTIEFMTGIKTRLAALDADVSELEELQSEIEDWRDNMPESLQGSDKYSTLDETANTLDNVVNELNGLDRPMLEVPEDPKDLVGFAAATDQLAELPDDLEEWADSVEAQAEEAEGVEFPGMMG